MHIIAQCICSSDVYVVIVHKALFNLHCINLRLHDASVPITLATTWVWMCMIHLNCHALSLFSLGWPSLLSQVCLIANTTNQSSCICSCVHFERPNDSVSIGLYICEDDENCPKRFRGLGVRIEDDVVIQEEGVPLILSADTPKTIVDVEKSCSQKNGWTD